jgi:hypothetical protein
MAFRQIHYFRVLRLRKLGRTTKVAGRTGRQSTIAQPFTAQQAVEHGAAVSELEFYPFVRLAF